MKTTIRILIVLASVILRTLASRLPYGWILILLTIFATIAAKVAVKIHYQKA